MLRAEFLMIVCNQAILRWVLKLNSLRILCLVGDVVLIEMI
jgi:hypothetical protein